MYREARKPYSVTAVFFSLLFFTSFISHAQVKTKGKEFWACFMDNVDVSANGMPRFSFLISADQNTSGTIALPSTGYTQSFTVTAGQVTEAYLPLGVFRPTGSEYIDSIAFLITAADTITVTAHHHQLYFGEAAMILPSSELKDDYIVMANHDIYSNPRPSEFVVLATEDNTIIDITPSAFTLGLRPPGITFSIALDRGQIYQVQSYADLTSTQVKARGGKKIAVFSGAKEANVYCTFASDHLYEQDYPVASWGNKYAFIPYPQGGDILRILAAYDNTDIYFGCTKRRTLDRGQYFDTLLNVASLISSTHPVCAAQFSKGQDCSAGNMGDPSMVILTPVTSLMKKVSFNSLVLNTSISSPYLTHYVNVYCRTADLGLLTLDGNPVATQFSGFASDPAYSYARLPLAAGTHALQCDSGFVAAAYGYGYYIFYGYALGADHFRNDAAASLAIDALSSVCAGESTQLNGTSTQPVASWSWSISDGSSYSAQNPSHTFSSGTHTVTLSAVGTNGCVNTVQAALDVAPCIDESADCEIFVPNIFAPGKTADHNGKLCVYGQCIRSFKMMIFDRWGEKVFETESRDNCWDGSFRGAPLNTGVFVYYLEAELFSGNSIKKKGDISLIR